MSHLTSDTWSRPSFETPTSTNAAYERTPVTVPSTREASRSVEIGDRRGRTPLESGLLTAPHVARDVDAADLAVDATDRCERRLERLATLLETLAIDGTGDGARCLELFTIVHPSSATLSVLMDGRFFPSLFVSSAAMFPRRALRECC